MTTGRNDGIKTVKIIRADGIESHWWTEWRADDSAKRADDSAVLFTVTHGSEKRTAAEYSCSLVHLTHYPA